MKIFVNSLFQKLYYIYFVISLFLVFYFSKEEIFLCVNEHHQPLLDYFFKYITYLGDGIMFAVVLIIFLLHKYYYAIITIATAVIQSIMVVILKKGIFSGEKRPLAFFDGSVDLHFVEGVDVHSYNTFPSGHTATGFAVFGLLAFVYGTKNSMISALCLILAILVGISRVYLSQHFYMDTFAGSLVGLLSIYVGIAITNIFFNDKKQTWISHSLLNRR